MAAMATILATCAALQAPLGSRIGASRLQATAPRMQMPQAATQLVTLLGRAPEQIEFSLVMDAISECAPRSYTVHNLRRASRLRVVACSSCLAVRHALGYTR